MQKHWKPMTHLCMVVEASQGIKSVWEAIWNELPPLQQEVELQLQNFSLAKCRKTLVITQTAAFAECSIFSFQQAPHVPTYG